MALIRTALEELPVGLDAKYERLLQKVDPRFHLQVASSLRWLAFSKRVLHLEELADVFILRPDRQAALDEAERFFEPRHVLKYFSSLVVTQDAKLHGSDSDSDSDSDSELDAALFAYESDEDHGHVGSGISVRLAHYSIREYLVSERITQTPAAAFAFSETDAHLHIAHSCLAYHLQNYVGNREAAATGRLWLRNYAAHHWPQHLELVPRQLWPPETADAAARALTAGRLSLYRMMQVREFRPWVETPGDGIDHGDNQSREHAMTQQPLWFMARLGFVQLIDMLLSSDKYLTQESLDTAMVEAAYGGRTAAVEFLLGRGASLDATCEPLGLDALQAAAYRGHRHTVRTLLSCGANIDAQNGGFGSALRAACAGDRPRIVRLLLRRGAKLDLRPSNADSSLLTSAVRYACESGSAEILQLLLDNGLNVNTAGGTNAINKETPLHAAALRIGSAVGTRRHFHLLVERGADVNAQGGEYGYPLQALCHPDDDTLKEMQLLLEKGADVNARGGKYGSALQCACHYNRKPIDGSSAVELLLSRGADPHARGGYYETVLQAACTSAEPYTGDLIRLLLKRDIDVHAQGGYFGNALQASCFHGNLEVAELLLELGVGVNVSAGEYGSALQAAAASKADPDNAIMRLLLDRGAHVNYLGGRYGTALQAAAFTNDIKGVQLLLELGADINLAGGEYGTALQAACAHSSIL